MSIRKKIACSIDNALAGQRISIAEMVDLLQIPLHTEEYFYLIGSANILTRKLAGNQGMVGAQIGLNVEPCSKNCEFCSFGAKHHLIEKGYRLTEDQLVREVKAFVEAGANYVSLMTTADYPFDNYIQMSLSARKVMPSDMMLSANIGDFGREEAKQLKIAGYGRIYHVIRLGEGVVTEIDVDDRIKTLEIASEEGLEIAFCIEPVGPEHRDKELAEKIDFSLQFNPTMIATMRRIPIAGTRYYGSEVVPEIRMAQILATARLAYAHSHARTFYIHEPSIIGLMAGANLICAEKSGNPREINEKDQQGRGLSVKQCLDMLNNAGYIHRTEANYPGSWFSGYKG
jgi:biotin synthase